jgi:hypothetical protein
MVVVVRFVREGWRRLRCPWVWRQPYRNIRIGPRDRPQAILGCMPPWRALVRERRHSRGRYRDIPHRPNRADSVPQQTALRATLPPYSHGRRSELCQTACIARDGAGSDGGCQGRFRKLVVFGPEGLGDRVFDTPVEPVVVEQKGRLYLPHVLAVRAHQTLQLGNHDPTSHNPTSHNIDPVPATIASGTRRSRPDRSWKKGLRAKRLRFR